ncbi:MAG: TIGR03620 family F420-dependent LLM class oxidoreductase [Actinobacteria bacterium]|nr:TIGR03620 family F420-dependent LLM class oxidoreductase [Actinomycetota bacterium]
MHTTIGTYGVWASQLGLLPAEDAAAHARTLEELGFDTLWVGEASTKEALTHAGLLLAATDTITVATGIANLWARDATAMVNGARTLADAYPGRFVLGIGASHPPLLDRRGQGYDKPLTATREYLEAMTKADWTGPEVADPPTVLAALGPKMLALAAEASDGAHTFLVPVEHTRRARQALGPDRWLAPEQAVVVADSRAAARRLCDGHLAGYLSLGNYRRNLERLGWDVADPTDVPDDLFDALIAWGDPEGVAARVREHLDAGADHVALHGFTDRRERFPVDDLAAVLAALRSA